MQVSPKNLRTGFHRLKVGKALVEQLTGGYTELQHAGQQASGNQAGGNQSGIHPSVAVIVPVYNNAADIRRCAASILDQTYPKVSLYLVNDGSTDGRTAKILDEIKSEDDGERLAITQEAGKAAEPSRVHVIHKSNEGPMATALRGVQESTEPFLMFVDGDDYIETDLVEKMVRELELPGQGTGQQALQTATGTENAPLQIICGGYVIDREWNDSHENKGNGAAPGTYTGETLQHQIREKILGHEDRTVLMSRCMKLFSRELLEQNAHYCDPSIRMGDDLNVILPAVLDAERIVILSDNYDYHYLFQTSSQVNSFDTGMYDNICRLDGLIRKILADKKILNAQTLADREFLILMLYVMRNELRNPAEDAESRVREICLKAETPRKMRRPGITAVGAANRLIAFVMQDPAPWKISMVRKIFELQDKRSR